MWRETWQDEMAARNQDQVANPFPEHEADSVEIPARVSRALVWENRSRNPMIRFGNRYLTVSR